MHPEAYMFVQRTNSYLYPRPKSVVEIGARNINGTIRHLFSDATDYVGIDIADGPDVDVVANGATWQPDPKKRPDLVICCEVLEHTAEADEIVRNAVRMVKGGGHVIVTCAGTGRPPHSAFDGGPLREGEYYRNVTKEQVEDWIESLNSMIRNVEYAIALQRGDLYFHIITRPDGQDA